MNLCIFSSSSHTIDPVYFEAAAELGILIGKAGHQLIHGGGMRGLMGSVAEHVQRNGGKVIGVIPEKLNQKGIVRELDDETIITVDLAERKKIMFEKADAFIALPGGFGTLEELLEVITLKQLGYHDKPVLILNTNNFFDHLLKQFETVFAGSFAETDCRSLYLVLQNSEEIMIILSENNC